MIPKIGDTDGTPFDEKTIHQVWIQPQVGFYWLIAELDGDEAFGYANLNCEIDAEWGYISIKEIKEIDAKLLVEIEGMNFAAAKRLMNSYFKVSRH